MAAAQAAGAGVRCVVPATQVEAKRLRSGVQAGLLEPQVELAGLLEQLQRQRLG